MSIPPRPSKTVLSPESGRKKEEKSLLGTFLGIFDSEKPEILKSDISSPFNAVHLTHVRYNDESGEFQGLPSEWEALLRESGITKQDQKSNPQAVIDVMSFYSETQKRSDDIFLKINSEFLQPPKKPPRSISKEDLTSKDSPPPTIPPRPLFTMKQSNVAEKSTIYEQFGEKKPPRSSSVESLSNSITTVQLQPKLPPKPKTPKMQDNSPPAVRPRKKPLNLDQVMDHLKKISKETDPLTQYSNLIKIGQGASGGVFSASSNTGEFVALKQINLENQPKKDLIINEIIVMKDSKHKNIVNYIDSFIWKGDLWVYILKFLRIGGYGRWIIDRLRDVEFYD